MIPTINHCSSTQKTLPDPSQSLHLEDHIELNAEVDKIEWDRNDDTISIKTSEGRHYDADRVIFTASLGVLKEKHSSLFTPALSGKRVDAINGLSMGTVGKVYMRFDQAFWPSGWGGVHILWTKDTVDELNENNRWLSNVMGFLTVDGQPNTLSAWLAGVPAKEVEQLDEAFVVSELLALLRKLVPQMEVKDPVETKR